MHQNLGRRFSLISNIINKQNNRDTNTKIANRDENA